MDRRRRQFVLFLIAVVLPAAALSLLAIRFLRQEDELKVQRGNTDRANAAQQARRELNAKLEKIQLLEVNRRFRQVGSPGDAQADPAIVFVSDATGHFKIQ